MRLLSGVGGCGGRGVGGGRRGHRFGGAAALRPGLGDRRISLGSPGMAVPARSCARPGPQARGAAGSTGGGGGDAGGGGLCAGPGRVGADHQSASAAGRARDRVLAGSVVVLPVLGYIKLRLARQSESQALRGDGVLSAAGTILAAAALASLAADRTLGGWQADPVAASLIALFLFREGWRTLARPCR